MSTHDDPVVVDNGPVRVDFGARPAVPDRANRTFTRACWRFRRLVVAVVDAGGVLGRVTVHDLARGPVTFRLVDGQTGAPETLRFEVSLWGKLTVTQQGDTFELTNDGRELKARAGRDPRIEDIQQNEKGLIENRCKDVGTPGRTVVATLIPKSSFLSTIQAVAVGAAVVAAVAYILASHDDPVVVDNGPITIHRPGKVPDPDGERWTFGKIDKLKLLHVLSWKTGTPEPFVLAPPISLEGVHDITFDLVKGTGQPTTSMTIFRDAWNESFGNQHARVRPKGLFKAEGGGLATLDPDYRVAQIRLDSGDVVCLRDGERPKAEKCTSWTYTPERIKVVLCTANEDKCRAVMSAH